jgi:hypothetical protein
MPVIPSASNQTEWFAADRRDIALRRAPTRVGWNQVTDSEH